MSDLALARQHHAAHVAARDAPVTVVGFYTPAYEGYADLLAASLERASMPFDLVAVEDAGSWDANVAVKAEFLRSERESRAGPVLYLDADAFVHENCEGYFRALHDSGVDFGAHFYAGPSKGYEASGRCACLSGRACSKPHRMLSGTLFIGDTGPARNLLATWEAFNAACRSVGWMSGGGQRNLWAVVASQSRHLTIERIPGRYCYVFDRPESYPAGEPVVIEHTLASHDHRGSRPHASSTRRARIAELRAVVGI